MQIERAGCVPCLFMPTKGARKMVVYFHGNGCDLGSLHDELGRYRDFWKVHLLAVEYPGYGACVGAPSEESITCVASAVFRYVTRTLRWPPMFVYLYGRSIGTGPVCKLAADLISRNASRRRCTAMRVHFRKGCGRARRQICRCGAHFQPLGQCRASDPDRLPGVVHSRPARQVNSVYALGGPV